MNYDSIVKVDLKTSKQDIIFLCYFNKKKVQLGQYFEI